MHEGAPDVVLAICTSKHGGKQQNKISTSFMKGISDEVLNQWVNITHTYFSSAPESLDSLSRFKQVAACRDPPFAFFLNVLEPQFISTAIYPWLHVFTCYSKFIQKYLPPLSSVKNYFLCPFL